MTSSSLQPPDLLLSALPPGASAVVGQPRGWSPTILRLQEMGLTAGTHVTLVRRGPGGDPLEVRVRGTRLCLRRAEADAFPVTPGLEPEAPGVDTIPPLAREGR